VRLNQIAPIDRQPLTLYSRKKNNTFNPWGTRQAKENGLNRLRLLNEQEENIAEWNLEIEKRIVVTLSATNVSI
jgi:hypothetical protein